MRLLLATDSLPTPARGGLDLHVRDLLDSLADRGVRVQLAPLSSLHLRQVLKDTRPDVVHFHSLQGLSPRLPRAARESGSAVLWTLHDFHSICPRTHLHDGKLRPCEGPQGGTACGPCFGGVRRLVGGPLFTRRWASMRESLEACTRLIAPSAFVRDVLVGEGLDPGAIEVLAPSVSAPPRPAAPPLQGGRPRFVFAGDLRRAKGAQLVLRALEEVDRDCEVLIYGGPPAPPAPPEEDLEAELRQSAKGRAVRFFGRYAPGDMLAILDGALALVVPSLVRETFGRTANAALLARVPVLASGEGGLAEQVEDGVNGWLFEPGSAGSLAEAMVRMIDEGEAMSARSGETAGRSWPQAPCLEQQLDRLVALYEECA